jgi:sigma-E factor negative regulatory protein RseC
MAEMKQVEHEGIVTESVNNRTTVQILSQSACAGCHAKSACTAADKQDKWVEVTTHKIFTPGQKVLLVGNQDLGLKAAWWAYVLPVVLVLSTLIVTFAVTQQENLSGALALLVLAPYFLILKLAESHMRRTFSFKIKSFNE